MKQVVLPKAIGKIASMICGCAPVEVWESIYEVLKSHGKTENVGLVHCLCDHVGMTEHGTSLRGAWLTDEGRRCLEFFNTYGADWSDSETVLFVDEDGVAHTMPEIER